MDKIDFGSRKGFTKFIEPNKDEIKNKPIKKLVKVTHDENGKPYVRPTWKEE